jgi:uncharacterized protein
MGRIIFFCKNRPVRTRWATVVLAAALAGCGGPGAVAPTVSPLTSRAPVAAPTPVQTPVDPLAISAMRAAPYPGSDLAIEQTLAAGINYDRYIASYRSDDYKIFGLLTVPRGPRPASGWPVIVFNHGYIPPQQYRTTERYVAYQDALARHGYLTFKSDYRGHRNSQGFAAGGYGTPDYTVDVLNAMTTLQHYPGADSNRIGMWGHSMGGQLTLRSLVVSHAVKVAVIWGGVVAPYPDLITKWHPPASSGPPPGSPGTGWRQSFENFYGTPAQNPAFWASISPNSYVSDITAPVQLDHSVTDEEVPVAFSQTLAQELQQAGKTVELYTYPGDNHNISNNFSLAMSRTIAFFDRYLHPA